MPTKLAGTKFTLGDDFRVDRSVVSLASPVSVLAFGAKGDGVTDDTVAIQAAINAVQAAGGGNLLVPSGVFNYTALSVPAGVVCNIIGFGEQSVLRCTSATGHGLTVSAWYSRVCEVKFSASVTRTANSFVYLVGAHAVVEKCRFVGDYIGVILQGVGTKALFNTFDSGASGARRIWATGGDTSQTIQGNLMNAQAAGVAAGIFVDNSSALKILNNDIIGQGRCLHLAPGAGQSIFSLKSQGNFYDTAVYGIAVEPSSTGAVRRCYSANDWMSSHTSDGAIVSATTPAIADGFDFLYPEAHLNTGNGITVTGSGAINTRIRRAKAKQNSGAAVSMSSTTSKVRIHALEAQAADGLTANAYGVFISSGADQYEIIDSDLTGQTTGAIAGHTTGSTTKIVARNRGYVTEAQGIATVIAGGTSIVVSHGLSTTPTKVFVSPLGDAAGRHWSQQSSWTSTQLTISQNATLGYDQSYVWRAEI